MRRGQSLVGTYNGPNYAKKFRLYHCKGAFTVNCPCFDAVCNKCKHDSKNNDHSCPLCGQKMVDYKLEEMESMMPRMRPKWPGPGP